MQINVVGFLDSLMIMLTGMIGIFVVMLVIYAVILLLGKLTKSKE